MLLKSLITLFFLILMLFDKQQHGKEKQQTNIRPVTPEMPTNDRQHHHHQDANNRRYRRRKAFDLGTTDNVTPEEFVDYERKGYFVALTPILFNNNTEQKAAIVVVAHSESDYLQHEAEREYIVNDTHYSLIMS
jgi:hypothetical protein